MTDESIQVTVVGLGDGWVQATGIGVGDVSVNDSSGCR